MGNIRKMANGRNKQEREHVKSPVLVMVSGCAIKTLPVIHFNRKEKNRKQRVFGKVAAAHTKGTAIMKCVHNTTTFGYEFPDLTEFLFHNSLSLSDLSMEQRLHVLPSTRTRFAIIPPLQQAIIKPKL
jgi:hypothetical protein